MGFLSWFPRPARRLAASVYSALPVDGVSRPVFILGCGRSGTTILGTALSKHREIAYLNEPRRLWFAAYPQSDIWTNRAAARNGKLILTAADAQAKKSKKLRRLFEFERLLARKSVLVEKLPINSFRLGLILDVFPDARFVHIYRNGFEVAQSIARECAAGPWFGYDSYKWQQLVKYAFGSEQTASLPSLCSDYFRMGLLEWRLSTEATVKFLDGLPQERFVELSYDRFLQDPKSALEQTLSHLGLEIDDDMLRFVEEQIVRQGGAPHSYRPSDEEWQIGGALLPMSMDSVSGLTRRAA